MNTNLISPGRRSARERHLQGTAMLWTMALASWTPRHLQGCIPQHSSTNPSMFFSTLLPKFLGLLPAPASPDGPLTHPSRPPAPPPACSGAQKMNEWDDASLQDVPE